MPHPKRRVLLVAAIVAVALFIGVAKLVHLRFTTRGLDWDMPQFTSAGIKHRLSRPYGMAPAAFDGFVRACNAAKVHPWRISQTIGNHPRSVGYHHRDGTVTYRGKRLDYTAAVDIVTSDLDRPHIMRLVEELGRQGFAAFYREGPRWVNGEHIHAIYAPLKMKPQLRRQVREWEGKRRRAGKPAYRWQKRWRRMWRA